MFTMNISSTKFYCRTCLEQKNDLLSLYTVDVNVGIQICEMILQTSQVQVSLFLFITFQFSIFISILDLQQTEHPLLDLWGMSLQTEHCFHVPAAMQNIRTEAARFP